MSITILSQQRIIGRIRNASWDMGNRQIANDLNLDITATTKLASAGKIWSSSKQQTQNSIGMRLYATIESEGSETPTSNVEETTGTIYTYKRRSSNGSDSWFHNDYIHLSLGFYSKMGTLQLKHVLWNNSVVCCVWINMNEFPTTKIPNNLGHTYIVFV